MFRSAVLRAEELGTSFYRRVAAKAVRGDEVACPCCGSRFRRFAVGNRVCWLCSSRERHRTLKLYFDAHPAMLGEARKILHVAPEPPIAKIFKEIPDLEYHSGDIEQRFGPEYIDVTDIPYPEATFDGLVCNHVLEHVPDDRKALEEVRRVLKPSGWAVLLIPSIRGATTIEDAKITDPAERKRLFGQHDHVRRYGWDYIGRIEAAGLVPEVFKPEEHWSRDTIERMRLRAPLGIDPVFIGRPG